MARPFISITRGGRPEDIPLVGRIQALCNRAALRTLAVVTGVVDEVAVRLIARTPVLTGTMVSNWTVSVDQPDPRYDQSHPDQGRTETLAKIRAALAAVRAGDQIYLNNGTPYLPYQEYGTRYLPARAFVRDTVAEVPGIVRVKVAEANAAIRDAPATAGLFRTLFRR